MVKQVVSNAIGWFQYKMDLESMVRKQNQSIQKQNDILKKQAEELSQVNEVIIDSLSNIVEFRNLSPNSISSVSGSTPCAWETVS